MTSIPPSRSARAMTLAPRSCPSRPGLAMTTRIFWAMGQLDYRLLDVLSPDVAQRVAHLADRGVGADRLEQQGHRIGVADGPVAQGLEGPGDTGAVARPPQRLELRQLGLASRLVDIQDTDRLVIGDERVD